MNNLYQMRQLLFYVFMIVFTSTHAQDAWQQVNDFPEETRIKTSFATPSGAVVLASVVPVGVINVFTYDAISDSWEQKADFPYTLGFRFTSFILNDEGYVICKDAVSDFNIFIWKYNLAADTWEPKTGTSYSDFGFGDFYGASFSINNLGYLLASGGSSEHFKEYNPISNTWTVKASYPGHSEGRQLGFSIGNRGYFAYNYDDFSVFPELWEYTPATDNWARKADVPLYPFTAGAVFSIGEYGYLGMEWNYQGSFYRYSPAQDLWELIENCGYGGYRTFSFSIGDFGYVGAGSFQDPSTGINVISREVWKLDPDLLSVIDNDRNMEIILYPIPSEETISLYGIDTEVGYKIFNLSGGLISEGKTVNKSLVVSSLASGVYILKISSEEKIEYKKFVKN